MTTPIITPTAPATSMRVHVFRDDRSARWRISMVLPGHRHRELPPCRTLADAIEALGARVVGWRCDGEPAVRCDARARMPLSLRDLGRDEYELVALDHEGYTPVLSIGDLWAETEGTT
jgi:hypothetical protein